MGADHAVVKVQMPFYSSFYECLDDIAKCSLQTHYHQQKPIILPYITGMQKLYVKMAGACVIEPSHIQAHPSMFSLITHISLLGYLMFGSNMMSKF